jgi:two-component system chemotaxis response regulator CheY
MPGMDGLQFLEQRRAEGLAPGVPVFMITTESSAPLVLRAIAAGARGYICKPFTPEQIRARVVPLLVRSLASA